MAIGGGGHASISDDGSGNVIVAAGKDVEMGTGGQIHVAEGTTGDPSLTFKSFPTLYGINFNVSGSIDSVGSGQVRQIVSPTYNGLFAPEVRTSGPLIRQPSADQAITGTGSTISVISGSAKITSDGVYTLTTALATETDCQECYIENVSANTVTLQEGVAVAQGAPVLMRYSTDAGVWEQV
jgi:hypothetical protein